MADQGGKSQVLTDVGLLGEMLDKTASIPFDSSMEESLGWWGYVPVIER